MTPVEVRVATEEDLVNGLAGMRQTFNYPPASIRRYQAWPAEAHRAMLEDGRWRGGLIGYRMEQWFGGRPVTCACVYGVQVDPAARGRGLGRVLFARTLADLAGAGVALAPLYPSDARLYRSWGWEFAGVTAIHRMPVTAIAAPRGEPPAAWDSDADLALVDACQRRLGRRHDGALLRTPLWWEQRSSAPPRKPRHTATWSAARTGSPAI